MIEGVLGILVVLELGLGTVAVLLVPMRLLQSLIHRMLRAPPARWVKRRLGVRIHRVPHLILALLIIIFLLIEGRKRSGAAHLILLKVQYICGLLPVPMSSLGHELLLRSLIGAHREIELL